MVGPPVRPGDPRGWGYPLNDYLTTLEQRIIALEGEVNATVGPQGPAGAGVAMYPEYAGLEMIFGPEPLPPANTLPNTVYVVLPPPP